MASVLNRTTKEFLRSVNTPDYPVADWIINPVLSSLVLSQPSKYWNIVGDTVSLMSRAEMDAVDAAEAATRRARVQADAQAAVTDGQAVPSPAPGGATTEERLRALELRVYGG